LRSERYLIRISRVEDLPQEAKPWSTTLELRATPWTSNTARLLEPDRRRGDPGRRVPPGLARQRYDDTALLAVTSIAFALGVSSAEGTKHLVRDQAGVLAGIALPELRTLRPRLGVIADGGDPLALQRELAAAAITVNLDTPATPRLTRALTLLLDEINAATPRMPRDPPAHRLPARIAPD
jgi:hypothetical protein